MIDFVPGLDLARTFYADVVEPLITVPHTAALIGEGSEVLGFDTTRSTDHEWGPRLQLFVAAADVERVRSLLDHGLPDDHRGYPVRWFSLATRQVAHHVEVSTLSAWLSDRYRLDTTAAPAMTTAAWLATPQQHLLQLTAGAVFRDDDGALRRWRAELEWYPDDVWRWLIACQWQRIGELEPFLGRAVELDDRRGARGARRIGV